MKSSFLLCCVILSSLLNNSNSILSKDKLLAFLSITSAPNRADLRDAIRNTWLVPCIQSAVCDYRFFVDINAYSMSQQLRNESQLYGDMVFRDACPLMLRHPPQINYGNSPPTKENVSNNQTKSYTLDYPARRMYKIDWKVCFLQYIAQHHSSVLYHVFVEDDSFIYTKNLLFQLSALQYKLLYGSNLIKEKLKRVMTGEAKDTNAHDDSLEMDALTMNATLKTTLLRMLENNDSLLVNAYDEISLEVLALDDHKLEAHLRPYLNNSTIDIEHNSTLLSTVMRELVSPFAFRTGTFMYDGFDDSSTIMNHHVAKVFQQHYPSEPFHCNHVLDSIVADWNNTMNTTNSAALSAKSMFLSWGNSWMARQCRWGEEIDRLFHVKISKPNLSCQLSSILDGSNVDKSGNVKRFFSHHHHKLHSNHTEAPTIQLELPCVAHPLILHHHQAPHVLLHEEHANRIAHLCEYMLLVDKVKSPQLMYELYNRTCETQHSSNSTNVSSSVFYHDFSDLFLFDAKHSWNLVLEKLQAEENGCQDGLVRRNHSMYEDQYAQHGYPCLFASPNIVRRKLNKKKRTAFLRAEKNSQSVHLDNVLSFRDYLDPEFIRSSILMNGDLKI